MPVPIRYLVPYEAAVHANDLGSGKPVTNILYLRNSTQPIGPPVYGGPVAGSSNDTLCTNFLSNWVVFILPILNANYKMRDVVLRSIIGKRYGTPLLAISSFTAGSPAVLTTSAPHALATGMTVSLQDVTAPPLVNGNWVITKIDATTFALNGSTFGPGWSNDGTVQRVTGPLQFLYGDTSTQVSAAVGGTAGDALPLFCTGSIRRLNTGTGRNFRSRLSLSPISESQSVDGGFTGAAITAINAAFAAFLAAPFANGGADPNAGVSTLLAVSKAIAFNRPTPFTTQTPWTAAITLFSVQRNTGSLTRRKPRLTAVVV
jgi:hypothetical protein